jgi:tripartite-type tricarboxylate transporter receptor subunit TctC
VNRALASPEMKERLANLGGEAMHMSPEQFDQFLRKENGVLGKVMRDAGVKPQ